MSEVDWITEETGEKPYMRKSFKVKDVLFSGKSDFQKVDVVDTLWHGRMLFNDGLAMISEKDEFVYHDMISHVPLFVHPDPKRVLIIGGGDGGTAREVLRHKNIEKCVMVEIDKMVVDACMKHIPQTALVLNGDDHRLELIIGDGAEYVNTTKEVFDVILVDSTDPIGPSTPLFGKPFYENVDRILSSKGIVVSQGESPWHNQDVQKSLLKILRDQFSVVKMYTFSNLTYPDGLWCFSFASKGLDPVSDLNPQRIIDSKLDFKYYNEEIHRASFSLPNFLKEVLL